MVRLAHSDVLFDDRARAWIPTFLTLSKHLGPSQTLAGELEQ
jgi:hypothetical protein